MSKYGFTVSHDGRTLFHGTENQCFVYVQRHQGQSVDYAVKHGGYAITENTKPLKLTTRGSNGHTGDIPQAIASRIPFTTNGALMGEYLTAGSASRQGSLPDTIRAAEWHDAVKDHGRSVYVVWSYETPIAWHTPNGWIVPSVRYSITTSKHQGTLYLIDNDDIIARPNPDPDRYGQTRAPSSTGGVWAG